MRRRILFTTLIALGLIAGASSAARADESNNIFRFGAAYVVPDGEAVINGANVSIDAEDDLGYFVDYERRLIPWLGIDFQVLYATPAFDATPIGGPTVENAVTVWTGNVGVNFHFFGRARVDLYAGVFGGYTDFDAVAEVDGAYAYGAALGLDIGLTKGGLALVIGVRYSKTEADSTLYPGTSVPYDPLVGTLGLGWRF